jgi:hypothetical protein
MISALRSRELKVLGLILAALVLAVGFCLFDGDSDGYEHPGFDLCLGMLVTSLAVTLVSRLPLAGSASAERLASVLEFSLRVPSPPPKTVLA